MPENPLSTIAKIDPKLFQHLRDSDDLIFGDGALPGKYKVLIALAFDAAHGATAGVASLARRAISAGATSQEIVEAIRVAYHLGGVGSVYTASQALKDVVGTD